MTRALYLLVLLTGCVTPPRAAAPIAALPPCHADELIRIESVEYMATDAGLVGCVRSRPYLPGEGLGDFPEPGEAP